MNMFESAFYLSSREKMLSRKETEAIFCYLIQDIYSVQFIVQTISKEKKKVIAI